MPWQSLFAFVIITLMLGGAAAFMTGRALANGWRPQTMVLLAAQPLAGPAPSLHAPLADQPTDALKAALTNGLMIAFAYAGFALRRKHQMARQYPWLVGSVTKV